MTIFLQAGGGGDGPLVSLWIHYCNGASELTHNTKTKIPLELCSSSLDHLLKTILNFEHNFKVEKTLFLIVCINHNS